MLKKLLFALIIIVLGGCFVYSTWFNQVPAPAVRLTSLSGHTVTMASLTGRVVLVNFWATSCPSCVEEMPKLTALHKAYAGQKFTLLTVAMRYDKQQYIEAFVQRYRLPYFVAHDSQGTLAEAFGHIQLTPTTLLFDRRGYLVKRYIGPLDFNELNREIKAHLK